MDPADVKRMTALQIARWASSMPLEHGTDACLALEADGRRCAQRAALVIRKRILEGQVEIARLDAMYAFEREVWASGMQRIAGVDEAGRGPLAGPVVAAAVILRQGTLIHGLNDSKQVTEPERERLFDVIHQQALAIGVGAKDVEYIEKHNIAQASFAAMRDALDGLEGGAQFILVDGFLIPGVDLPQRAIVKGDSLSNSIAAASIIAKVTRDRMMLLLDQRYPGYGFAHNKGYSTREHLLALDSIGLCPEHRRSFIPVTRAQMKLGLPMPARE